MKFEDVVRKARKRGIEVVENGDEVEWIGEKNKVTMRREIGRTWMEGDRVGLKNHIAKWCMSKVEDTL